MVRRAITKIAINSFVILILDETKQRGTNLFFKGELSIDNSCSASATYHRDFKKWKWILSPNRSKVIFLC